MLKNSARNCRFAPRSSLIEKFLNKEMLQLSRPGPAALLPLSKVCGRVPDNLPLQSPASLEHGQADIEVVKGDSMISAADTYPWCKSCDLNRWRRVSDSPPTRSSKAHFLPSCCFASSCLTTSSRVTESSSKARFITSSGMTFERSIANLSRSACIDRSIACFRLVMR